MRRSRNLVLTALLGACAASVAPTAHPRSVVRPPPRPIDLLSLVPEGAEGVVLVRGDRLRSTPVAALVAELLEEDQSLSTLQVSGIDPIRDFDEVLVAGRYRSEQPDVIAFKHHVAEEQLVQAFGRLAGGGADVGVRIKTFHGRRVAVAGQGPARLLLASPTVVAVTTADRLAALIDSLDHPSTTSAAPLLERLRALDARVPDLASQASVRVSARAPEDWDSGPGQLGLPRPDWVSGLVVFSEGASVYAHAAYSSVEDAARSEDASRSILTQTLHPAALFLRLMGLSRALESSQVARDGAEVTLRTHLDPEELQRVIDRLHTADDRG
jgi:hypothetical protein